MDANANPHEDNSVACDAARPQAPVVALGRHRRFLDVQPTVAQAEEHIEQHRAGEHADVVIGLDACDYYDGIARPLEPVVESDGAVSLRVAPRDPQPEELRRRVNDYLRWALEAYGPAGLRDGSLVEDGDLEPLPDEYSFARFLDTIDRRFNDERVGRHVGGRLHNFWHAIMG